MAQSLGKIVADFETQLAASVSIGATTATLSSATDRDGVALASGTYFLTFDGGNSKKEYVVATLSGTALTSISNISRQGVVTSGFARAHKVGSSVKITDYAALLRIVKLLTGETQFDSGTNLGYDGAPVGLTGNQFATVAYVLSVVSGGTVTFDQQVIANQTSGEALAINDVVYFKEADQRWWKADADLTATFDLLKLGICKSTAVGAGSSVTVAISGPVSGFSGLTAGSKYYLSNTAGGVSASAGTNSVFLGWALSTTVFLFSTTEKTLPTQKEKDAMAGSTDLGTPSTTNKFYTEEAISQNSTIASTDQSQTTQNATIETGEADATTKKNLVAQSFITAKKKISGVKLYKSADTGSFVGTVTISLQADSAGSPSGSNLASVTLTSVQWLAIATGEFTATFSSEYTAMTIGSTYWIVIDPSTSDNSNHPNLGTNSAGGYASGSVKYKNTTDGWVAVSTVDLYFKTLEGVVSQIVKTDSTGKIPVSLMDVDKKLSYNNTNTGVDTSSGIIDTITIPANTLGTNKAVRILTFLNFIDNGNARNITFTVQYGTSGAFSLTYSKTGTSALTSYIWLEIMLVANGATNSQLMLAKVYGKKDSVGDIANVDVHGATFGVDSTANANVVITADLSSAVNTSSTKLMSIAEVIQ